MPSLTLDTPLPEAACIILSRYAEDMRQRGEKIPGDAAPEHVHQMRVAIRRMRATLRLFEGALEVDERVVKGLRRTARTLGRVRDLDVAMENVRTFIAGLPEERQPAVSGVLGPLAEQHTEQRAALLAYLSEERYERFLRRLERTLTQRVAPGAPLVRHRLASMVYTRYEAVREYETRLQGAPAEVLHDLRIAGKELRYTLSAFKAVLGEEVTAVLAASRALQDHLGAFNDADVGQALALRTLPDIPERAALVDHLQNEAARLRAEFPGVWAQVTSPETRRSLALAVAVV